MQTAPNYPVLGRRCIPIQQRSQFLLGLVNLRITRTFLERYNIVSLRDLKDAARKLENYLARENGDKTETILPADTPGHSLTN